MVITNQHYYNVRLTFRIQCILCDIVAADGIYIATVGRFGVYLFPPFNYSSYCPLFVWITAIRVCSIFCVKDIFKK